jgi:hypothetical protein
MRRACPRGRDEEGHTAEDGEADAPGHAVHAHRHRLGVVGDDQAAEHEYGEQEQEAASRTAHRRAQAKEQPPAARRRMGIRLTVHPQYR